MVATYRARRRIETAPGVWREPEQLLPEASAWVRVDAWLHGGHIVKAEVSEDDFNAALAQFCPEQADWLRKLAGLDPAVALQGPHDSPRRIRKPTKPAAKPASPELIALKE